MNMQENTSSILAIDVGYGNLKAVWGGDGYREPWREVCFRSVSPRITHDVTVAGFASSDRVIVQVEDGRYAVGPHADRLVGGQLALHPNYIETPEYEALIRGAWHYRLRDLDRAEPVIDLLVLGLPVSNYAQQRSRLLDLGSRLRPIPLPDPLLPVSPMNPKVVNVRARQVLVLPQPLGSLMVAATGTATAALQNQEGLSLVIDPGYCTFDWLVADGMMPRMDISGAFSGGVSRLLRAVSRKVSQDHGVDAPELPRIEQALQEGVLNTGVRKIDMAPYAWVMEREAASVVSGFLQRFVPGELGIRRIVLTGGGAKYYLGALHERLPEYDIEVLPESVMGNVRGYYRLGNDLLATQ